MTATSNHDPSQFGIRQANDNQVNPVVIDKIIDGFGSLAIVVFILDASGVSTPNPTLTLTTAHETITKSM